MTEVLIDGADELMRMMSVGARHSGSASFKRWCAERLWIKTKAGEVVPFRMWPMQRRYLAAKRWARMQGKPPRFLLLKYRRGGFTTLEQAESYRLVTTRSNMNAVTLADTADKTAQIFRMSHMFYNRDPDAPPIKGVGNAHRLDFPTKNSQFHIGTAGGQSFGRSDTLHRVHGSEVSRWCRGPKQISKQEELIAGLSEAASHGEIVLETTPHGVEYFCHLYREAKRGMNDWTPIFLPWYEDRNNCDEVTAEQITEIRDTLADSEKELIAKRKLKWPQIAWRRRKQRNLKRLFSEEYPEDDETCFVTSGQRFFDVQQMLALQESLPDYPRPTIPGGYLVKWAKPEKGVDYVAGVDCSEGIEGGDYNGVGVLRRDTGEQVAAAHGLFRPSKLADIAVKLCREYNDAFLGIEVENHGHAVVQKAIELGYRDAYRQLYHHEKRRPGWSTNSGTRPVLIDNIADALHDGLMKVRDKDFLSECMTFGLQGRKLEHDPGAHDDCIFKWAIAWQMRQVPRHKVSIQQY